MASAAAVPPEQQARPLTARELAEAERRLNSPTPLTLRLLGAVSAAVLLQWGMAKVACNVRESPVRQPDELPTETLAKNAKSAALELSQRAASGRYREAAELAKGEVAAELLAADERCKSEPAPCEKRRSQLARTFTRAVVASRGPFEANVRTESRVGGEQPERFAMRVEQTDGRWFVTRRSPLDGPVDAPVAPEEMVSPIAVREVPAPPGSGPLLHPHGMSPHGVMPHGAAPQAGSPHGAPPEAPPAPATGTSSGTGSPTPPPAPAPKP